MITLFNNFDPSQISHSFKNESDFESIYWKYHNVDNSYSFEIIDMIWWRNLLLEKRAWAYFAAGIYAVTIFGLQKYMKNRPAFDLKVPLIFWNGAIGIFSIMGFVRTFPYVAKHMTGLNGIYTSICVRQFTEPPMAFWGFSFAVSKYVELGDTLFIVLRKRPLQPLQWFHHIAALILVWVIMPYNEPLAAMLMVVNYGVHSVMYPYFAVKMAGYDVPKSIANVITTAQFVQMIVGFLLNAATKAFISSGSTCYRSPDSIIAFAAVYGSFVILFGRLFNNSVLKRWSTSKKNQHTKKAL